jgi:hypothetical protein
LDSYANCKKLKQYHWADSYFMDSGAFSVWKSGKTISLADYIAFCKEHSAEFDVIAALDVVGDPEGSYRNYMAMREAGVETLPCFHMGEPIRFLELYAKETGYIGLGGMAVIHGSERHKFFREVFQRFPDPSVVGFHGFGVSDARLLRAYPWKSCDAASVHRVARYGGVWNPFGMRFYICPFDKSFGRNDVIVNPNERATLAKWVGSLGYDWELAITRTPDGLKERCKISIAHFEIIAKEVPTRYTVTHPTFKL